MLMITIILVLNKFHLKDILTESSLHKELFQILTFEIQLNMLI